MLRNFKYRIYPNKKTKSLLNKTLETCRVLYNNTLQRKIEHFKETEKSISLYECNKELTEAKGGNADLCLVHSQVLQEVQNRVDLAFQHFFRRIKQKKEKAGLPRFKGFGRYDSFTFKQASNGSVKILDANWLNLSKIGKIQIKLHRPFIGKVKTCSLLRTGTGKWYAVFSIEKDPVEYPSLTDTEIGIDLGLKTFAVLSNGEKIKNPKFFVQSEKSLTKAQQKLSLLPKGSKERAKQRLVVAKVHEKTANRRSDFCHKESRKIVDNYSSIFMEDLSVKEMMKRKESDSPLENWKNTRRHRNIGDVSWRQFLNFVVYKAEEAGRHVKLVNPRNTSKMCSGCGELVPKDLNVRIHNCSHCGLVLDRDLNASYNILRIGLDSLTAQAV